MTRAATARRSLLLVASLAWLAARAMPATAQSGGDPGIAVVTRAAQAYKAITSFQAAFHQHFDDQVLDIPDSRGELYQQGENHFAMRFTDPPHDQLIVDGTWLWLYTPSSTPGEVMRYPLQDHPTYGTDLLGTFLDHPAERYRVSYVRQETIDHHVTDAVLMEPTSNDLQFRRATVWFDRESGMPRRLRIEETPGHTRVLDLSQIQINRPIPPATFVFKKPTGVKVVTTGE